MNNFLNIKKNKGFTMVETLVAVAILMISIAGPLTIAQKGLMASIYARDQVIASFLAQDAMEMLKAIRDLRVNIGQFDVFYNWISSLNCPTVKCSINTPSAVIGTGNAKLYIIDNNYIHDINGKPTQFSRYFNFSNFVSNKEFTVTVTVEWQNGTILNKYVLENQMFNIIR